MEENINDDNFVDYNSIIQSLLPMFCNVITQDEITAVVYSCGEINKSIEMLLSIIQEKDNEQCLSGSPSKYEVSSTVNSQPSSPNSVKITLSYASAMSKLAKPKPAKDLTQLATEVTKNETIFLNTMQLQKIIDYNQKGYRVLIVMRGLPGSGKSYLARKIIQHSIGNKFQTYHTHICSTDDYFTRDNDYHYDRSQIENAHRWNQSRVKKMLQDGVSPIIVDNTNVLLWEMEPYIIWGIECGYIIQVVVPDTPWAWKPTQLLKKNKHNVPLNSLNRMLNIFQHITDLDAYLKTIKAEYPDGLKPPVMRKTPAVPRQNSLSQVEPSTSEEKPNKADYDQYTGKNPIEERNGIISTDEQLRERKRLELLEEKQKIMEELEKVSDEWENGSSWEDAEGTEEAVVKEATSPKPMGNQSWDEICDALPSWNVQESQTYTSEAEIYTTQCEASTFIEYNFLIDFHTKPTKEKVLTTVSRDININTPPQPKKIPWKYKVDKSTLTDEPQENKTKDFSELKELFNHISESQLKEIYDNCGGDVNWAVEIILDSGDICWYLPDSPGTSEVDRKHNTHELKEALPGPSKEDVSSETKYKKLKINNSEEATLLKKQLESNFKIGDEHYSYHYLKMRNSRRGITTDVDTVESLSSQSEDTNSDDLEESYLDDELVNFTLSTDTLSQLYTLFGTPNINNLNHIVPLISVPKSFLSNLYAVWMESLTHQMQTQQEYVDVLMKEDQEFARKLMQEEESHLNDGVLLPTPDFREIMESEQALNRVTEEWKSLLPNDIAYKLTKEKLFSLFPDMSQEALTEVLLAHDNNFLETVEVLLISTGRMDILSQDNGVNKFIMENESENQRQRLEQANQLSNLKEQLLEMEAECEEYNKRPNIELVNMYREEAQKHFKLRDQCHAKAQYYIRNGQSKAAIYYSQAALEHTKKVEMANNMAACSLLQVHSSMTPQVTIDLHFMHVPEAVQAMDLFLDYHIENLTTRKKSLFFITGRGVHSRGGPKIKPAIRKKLKQRGFKVYEVNPGLLKVDVTKNNKLTHQLHTAQ